MQCLNNGFNKLKMDDLIHIKMLIVQKYLNSHFKFTPYLTTYLITCFVNSFCKLLVD